MRRLLPIFLLAFTVVSVRGAGPVAPVNFTIAHVLDSGPEGPELPRSIITVGSRRISFWDPKFCNINSSPESLGVSLAKPGQRGEFTVINSPLQTDVDFVASTQAYFKQGEATIPKEAAAVEFKGTNNRAYVVNKWKSMAFDWTYTLHGRGMRRQVAFINIDEAHQICLTIVTDEETAEATFATAKRFMNSWYWADGLNAIATP